MLDGVPNAIIKLTSSRRHRDTTGGAPDNVIVSQVCLHSARYHLSAVSIAIVAVVAAPGAGPTRIEAIKR